MKQDKELKDMVTIVTGAAQGMGFAIAKTLAYEGAKVAVCDINGDKAAEAAKRIRNEGHEALSIQVDITKEQEVNKMVQTVIDEYGDICILVNNAGVLRPTSFEDITLQEWNFVLDINLTGSFLCSRAVIPIMKKNRFGRIVNMSSSAGRSVSTLGGAHYTAAKAGVLGLTRAVAKEVGAFGITVNAVCPGLIDTEMVRKDCSPETIKAYEQSFPIPRLGTPEEVANTVLFLVSDFYITGASIDINGGDLMM
jgi:3-oxoacyl-[acyl-carrier protein] reductase